MSGLIEPLERVRSSVKQIVYFQADNGLRHLLTKASGRERWVCCVYVLSLCLPQPIGPKPKYSKTSGEGRTWVPLNGMCHSVQSKHSAQCSLPS